MEIEEHIPLAHRMRPRNLEELVGQEHLTGPDGFIRAVLRAKRPRSMLLWGPPGSGKTTLARLIQVSTGYPMEAFSPLTSGVKDLRQIIDLARQRLKAEKRPTLLFVDEIHRFNKAQQEAFLPHVERGLIVLIGATTQNPSFEIIPPLLSRCRLLVLKSISKGAMEVIIKSAMQDKARGLGGLGLELSEDALRLLIDLSNGDARVALNTLEVASFLAMDRGLSLIDKALMLDATKDIPLIYDKSGEEHYNLISAFIKSMRGSDPQAALYWLYRMLESGEDRRFILRRMIRFASEDIGMRDPFALVLAVAAFEAFDRVGTPEGELSIAQACVYLARAPKDNSLYEAEKRVLEEIQSTGSLKVPLHLRNPVTRLMEAMGYGKGYIYPHDDPDTPQDYLPEGLKNRMFYMERQDRAKGSEVPIKAKAREEKGG